MYKNLTEAQSTAIAEIMLSQLTDGVKKVYLTFGRYIDCDLVVQTEPIPAAMLSFYFCPHVDSEYLHAVTVVVEKTVSCIAEVLKKQLDKLMTGWGEPDEYWTIAGDTTHEHITVSCHKPIPGKDETEYTVKNFWLKDLTPLS